MIDNNLIKIVTGIKTQIKIIKIAIIKDLVDGLTPLKLNLWILTLEMTVTSTHSNNINLSMLEEQAKKSKLHNWEFHQIGALKDKSVNNDLRKANLLKYQIGKKIATLSQLMRTIRDFLKKEQSTGRRTNMGVKHMKAVNKQSREIINCLCSEIMHNLHQKKSS